MATAVSPDCGAGKHTACNPAYGGWDDAADELLPCTCGCHR